MATDAERKLFCGIGRGLSHDEMNGWEYDRLAPAFCIMQTLSWYLIGLCAIIQTCNACITSKVKYHKILRSINDGCICHKRRCSGAASRLSAECSWKFRRINIAIFRNC